MKVKVVLGLTALVAMVFAAVAMAAPSPYKVTGGGQTFASADVGDDGKPTVKGPGDTITFQAFIPTTGESEATGQVNIIDRTSGAGGKGDHFRGAVDCAFLTPSDAGGYAELRGHGIKDDAERFFIVRIQDNGQGASADADLVEFAFSQDAYDCSDEDTRDDQFQMTLARGNAKIHKENTGASKSSSKSTTSLTSLKLGL